MRISWSSLALAGCILGVHVIAAGDNSERTKELVAVLQSPATLFEKARACQQLGEIGGKEAVPALAQLLSDDHLSAYARSGLEGIPDPSAAQALRTALGSLKGNLLTGVINSLGVLRDTNSVDALRPLAEDPASGVAKEALLALGRIDTRKSIAILRNALQRGADSTRADAAAGCLLAAQRQLADGHADAALKLDEEVRRSNVPAVFHGAATRGAILAHTSDRVPFLMKQLKSEDPVIHDAALLTLREIPTPALADALNGELDRASPDFELRLLSAMADCHNEKSIQLLDARATAAQPEIRLAALKVLAKIAGPAQTGMLLNILAETRDPAQSDLIEGSLERLDGAEVDETILGSLKTAPDSRSRIQLINLLAARGATNAAADLFQQAADSDEQVSVAALDGLGALAGAGQMPSLVALAKNCRTSPEKDAAEKAIVRAAARNGATDATGAAAMSELQQAADAVDRILWVRVLASLGYAKALPNLETAMNDADETVAANAMECLGNWPDPAPMDALLTVAESTANARARQRALASAIQLASVAADDHQRPEVTIAGWLKRAGDAAQSAAERRQIISVLGRVKCVESFQLLSPWLEQPDLQAEAALAIVQIAPALADGPASPAVKSALEKIATTARSADIRNQAAKLAASIHARAADAPP